MNTKNSNIHLLLYFYLLGIKSLTQKILSKILRLKNVLKIESMIKLKSITNKKFFSSYNQANINEIISLNFFFAYKI